MPWITGVLFAFVLLLQYSLWLGKGSLPHLEMVEENLQKQKQKNAELKSRNMAMEAEIQDLKRGYDAIEERARVDLNMVKPKEIFYEYLNTPMNNAIPSQGATLTEDASDSEESKINKKNEK
jgi:cell division protein FtsB